jgi:hypothetical protein
VEKAGKVFDARISLAIEQREKPPIRARSARAHGTSGKHVSVTASRAEVGCTRNPNRPGMRDRHDFVSFDVPRDIGPRVRHPFPLGERLYQADGS